MVATDDERGRTSASQQGDHEAFESLVKEYQHMIHSLCYRMTGSAADADDLAQETFVNAFQHLRKFRHDARFSSWLYRIALNQCLNWRKENHRRQRLQQEVSEEMAQNVSTHDNARTHLISEALQRLPAKQDGPPKPLCNKPPSSCRASRPKTCEINRYE